MLHPKCGRILDQHVDLFVKKKKSHNPLRALIGLLLSLSTVLGSSALHFAVFSSVKSMQNTCIREKPAAV